MIDLHNHILPGIDDGAADLDESIEIARQFVSEGVTRVVATPHLDPLRERGPSAVEVRRLVNDVREALHHAGVDLTILPGNELFLTPEAPALVQAGQVLTLGESKTLLVEISFDLRPLYLEDTLFRLELEGFGVVLAHPERYAFIQRDVSAVDALIDRSIPLQLTAPSLLGEYGPVIQRTSEQILRRGGYALAASDRHHPGSKRSLALLAERLTAMGDADLADLLLKENPGRLLAGKPLIQPEPLVAEERSFFARLFNRRAGA